MAGYGNKTVGAETDLTEAHSSTRYSVEHSDPYSGGSKEFQSGTVGGAGSGSKVDTASGGADLSKHHSETRYGISHEGAPYSGGHETWKSGTVGGPGIGNKTAGPKTGE